MQYYYLKFVRRQSEFAFFGVGTSVAALFNLYSILEEKTMKRTIKISVSIVCILMLALSLVACASMAKFEKNLGSDYKIKTYTDTEIKALAITFNLNPDDYGLKAVKEATNKETGCSVMIFECKSSSAAKKLVADSTDIVKMLESLYPSNYSFDAVKKGKFVLIGETTAINGALGK